MSKNTIPSDEPYCSNCGYRLTGLTESSKCPECGRPIVEVLMRRSWLAATFGRRYTSTRTIWGRPALALAMGPCGAEKRGHARGFVAVGDFATGVVAIGGFARGVFAAGGLAIGIVSFGGLTLGLLIAIGGLAMGGIASGGGAVGFVAQGGFACGYVADGGGAIGYIARGGGGGRGAWNPVYGHYVIHNRTGSPEALAAIAKWEWLAARPFHTFQLPLARTRRTTLGLLTMAVVFVYVRARMQGTPQQPVPPRDP